MSLFPGSIPPYIIFDDELVSPYSGIIAFLLYGLVLDPIVNWPPLINI